MDKKIQKKFVEWKKVYTFVHRYVTKPLLFTALKNAKEHE